MERSLSAKRQKLLDIEELSLDTAKGIIDSKLAFWSDDANQSHYFFDKKRAVCIMLWCTPV